MGAMIVGGMVGNYAARRQFESMSVAQAQQAQLDQATKAAQEAQAQAARLANLSNQGKKDTQATRLHNRWRISEVESKNILDYLRTRIATNLAWLPKSFFCTFDWL
jgi:hypothetical protein